MIRERIILAAFLALAAPAGAANATAPAQAPVVAAEDLAGKVTVLPVGEGEPVSPMTPGVRATPTVSVPAAKDVSPQAIPSSGVSPIPDVSPMLYGLLTVLALMAGALWLMKRMGMVKPGAASVGKIVGGVSLGNRERLVIVEVADQWIVVGVAPGRVSAVAQLPRLERGEASLEATAAAPNFSDWLKQTIDKRNGSSSR